MFGLRFVAVGLAMVLAAVQVESWPVARSDPSGSAHADFGTPASTWELLGRPDESYLAYNFPSINRDTVFSVVGNDHLYAINRTTGIVAWTHWVGGDGASLAAPIFNETIYVASREFYEEVAFEVAALSVEDGKPRWKLEIDQIQRGRETEELWGAGLAVGEYLYLATNLRVMAFNLSNGAEVWQKTLDGLIHGHPVVSDGRLFVATESSIYALAESTGALLWTAEAHGGSGGLAAASGLVVFAKARPGAIYALDARTGNLVWERDPRVGHLEGFHSPAIAYGKVFVGGYTRLWAFNLTDGEVAWSVPGGFFVAPAVSYGRVFSPNNGTLTALNSTNGEVIWEHDGDGFSDSRDLAGSPIVSDGVVYWHPDRMAFLAIDAFSGEIDGPSKQLPRLYNSPSQTASGLSTLPYVALFCCALVPVKRRTSPASGNASSGPSSY